MRPDTRRVTYLSPEAFRMAQVNDPGGSRTRDLRIKRSGAEVTPLGSTENQSAVDSGAHGSERSAPLGESMHVGSPTCHLFVPRTIDFVTRALFGGRLGSWE